MNLDIGKIIYVLNTQPPKLVPGQIVEQIISRKLNQEAITHVVKFTNGKDYTLENISKPWFPSIESAQEYLTVEAEKLIASVVLDGQEKARVHFAASDDDISPNTVPTDISNQDDPKGDSEIIVDLGDGKKAKVKMPGALSL